MRKKKHSVRERLKLPKLFLKLPVRSTTRQEKFIEQYLVERWKCEE